MHVGLTELHARQGVSKRAKRELYAPRPNPSIERTCLKPLRAFSPAAHVER